MSSALHFSVIHRSANRLAGLRVFGIGFVGSFVVCLWVIVWEETAGRTQASQSLVAAVETLGVLFQELLAGGGFIGSTQRLLTTVLAPGFAVRAGPVSVCGVGAEGNQCQPLRQQAAPR